MRSEVVWHKRCLQLSNDALYVLLLKEEKGRVALYQGALKLQAAAIQFQGRVDGPLWLLKLARLLRQRMPRRWGKIAQLPEFKACRPQRRVPELVT